MGLSIGIVGLPNVGKSTLFNALSGASVLAANYPFATKDPNVGVVPVPDERLDRLAALYKPKKTTHAALEFVDIAGLVKGASKGEGLGNQFLANIREVDAIAHVVRCFNDPDVVHVDGAVDPERDKEVVETELQLKDLESLEKKRERRAKEAKAPGKPGEEAKADLVVYDKLRAALEAGRPARSVALDDEEKPRARELFLLTGKPVLYVANVDESQLSSLDSDPLVAKVRQIAASEGARMVAICSKVEAEIQQLPENERKDFLDTVGLSEPGLAKLVREGFTLLGLQSYFTAGEDECRAWVVKKGARAPQAAGVIHTDFERGFIKAEVIRWDELLKHGSEAAAKGKGALRIEGKEYVVQDGDVMHFMFNV
ncbi:MAG TPA: redox-regulated ATPase YchF [Myxococcales bacterium]|jgi:GTP-binding protein YchF|nr:redox-regulated ATPase YchF [Myxococcales bacterium]